MNKLPSSRLTLAPTLPLLLSLAACGPAEPLSTSLISIDGLEDTYVGVICDSIDRCQNLRESYGTARAQLAGGRCQAWATRSLRPRFVALYQAVVSGRTSFDVAAAQRVFTRARQECLGQPDIDAALDSSFRGSLRPGARCTLNAECADGTCVVNGQTSGTCVARVALGQACWSDSECANPAGGWARCVPHGLDFTCAAVRYRRQEVPSGGACGFIRVNDREVEVAFCAAGNGCSRVPGTDGFVCRPTVGEGASCQDVACGAELTCVPTREESICRSLTMVREAGAACDEVRRFCDPNLNLGCAAGRCVSEGNGLEGSPCRAGLDHLNCAEGFACNADTSRCVPRRELGAQCSGRWDCQSSNCARDVERDTMVCADWTN